MSNSSVPEDSDQSPEAKPIIVVHWKNKEKRVRLNLPEGRYLIGDSAFAQIRIASSGTNLCGALYVTADKVILKCTGPQPNMVCEGRRMQTGESVILADVLEVYIGSTRVIFSQFVDRRSEPLDVDLAFEKREGGAAKQEESLQSAVNRCKGDPDQIRSLLSRALLGQMDLDGIDLNRVDSDDTRRTARLHLKKIIGETRLPDNFAFTSAEFEQQIFDEVMGLGPLEPLLSDSNVTEIMVNRRDQIFVEKKGKLSLSRVQFSSDQALFNIIERIVSTVGRRIDMSSPIVDARLLDGSRVNAIIPPLALKGPCLTIRRFSKTPISVGQLIQWGALTEEMSAFLELMVHERKNIVISGGTGSGKTTLLNALSSFIPADERIITVEDAAELQLQQAHVISLETRPANIEGAGAITIRDLVKNTLRMRPDRIIVGECRGGEALDMLQAMNTGHDGSMTTAHANTPEDLLRRLETMVMMAGMDLTLRAIREQIVSAVTVVVQIARRRSGRRLVTQISWIKGLEGPSSEYVVSPLFKRDQNDNIVVGKSEMTEFWLAQELPGTVNEVLGKSGKARKASEAPVKTPN